MAGTCRIEIFALHVHGEEADLDELVAGCDETMEKFLEEAELRWPNVEFMPPVEGSFVPEDDDDGT